MMPLGSQNSGGRSSNLSPLAPPFTLDKPYHKQHSSNPPLNFTEPFGPRFDRSRPVWSPSVNPTFGPNFTENSSKASFAPLEVHGFPVSQPNNSSSSSTRLAPLNPASGNVGYDGFPYGQYSNPAPTSLVEAKPYYPPYVVADDRELVARKEPSYDLLSNFGVAQLSGSSQVDDTQSTSGVKYTPQWTGIWKGLNDVEQVNWLDLGGNYGSKDLNHSEPSTGQQCLRKAGSLGPYMETSIKPTNCFDGFGGENNFGSKGIEDRKSFKEPNPGATAVSCIRVSAMGSPSACNEITQDPFLQHSIPVYGLYEGPIDSRDKHTNYADSYVFDSTSAVRSSPANMDKMTFGGFPTPQYAVPSPTVDAVSNEAMDKTEKSPEFLPYHPFGPNFRVSNYARNTDSLFAGSSSTILEDNTHKRQVGDDGLDLLLKTKSVSTIPHLSVPDCLKIKCDTAEAIYSMDKFSDAPDIQNPAEDSPCWKGARFSPFEDSRMAIPDIVLEMSESCFNQNGEEGHENSPNWKGARFSPFEDSRMAIPDIVEKMSESCFNQNGEEEDENCPDRKGARFSPLEDSRIMFQKKNGEEEHKNSPTRLDTADFSDTIHVLGEANENFPSKRSSNSKHVSIEHDGSGSMMQGLHGSKLFGGDGFQLFDKKNGLDHGIGNDLSILNYSGIASSSKNSQPLQTNLEGCEVMREEKPAPPVAETVAELKHKSLETHSSDVLSCSPTNAGDDMLHSPLGNVAASMTSQLSAKDSNSKVDISVLVNTVKNLSEVLVSHCSNSPDPITEIDCAALKNIISNLNSCLVKKADQATNTMKSQDPQQETSCSEGVLQVQMISKITTDRMDQHGLDIFGGGKANVICSTNEDLLDSAFAKGNAETMKDAETIQAMKRVLDMSFPSEEMQPETVMYKNLWLEAEAALCASTIKSRFNRMKIEMEKRVCLQANECPEEENIPVPKASDVNKVAESPHAAHDPPANTDMDSSVIARFRTLRSVVEDSKSTKPVLGHQSLSIDTDTDPVPASSCPLSQASDFESSVMARFQTLKSRADNSDLVSTEDGKLSASKKKCGPQSPPDQSMEGSYFSSMANQIEDPETAFMSRFNVLKARIEQSETMDMMGTQHLQSGQSNITPPLTSFCSTENRYAEDLRENVRDCWGGSLLAWNPKPPRKVNALGGEIFEGWYDCSVSEPGWEHVTKEGGSPNNKN